MGKYAEAYPDTVRRIIAAGHQVGNHLYDDKIPAFMSQKKVKEWLDLTESKLRELGARGPIRYRAPRLMVGLHTTRMMRARGGTSCGGVGFRRRLDDTKAGANNRGRFEAHEAGIDHRLT